MKITRETLPKMQCSFCSWYQECPSKYRLENGERLCSSTKGQVFGNSKSCKVFNLTKDFYCEKSNCWLDIAVCIARRKRDHEGCFRCHQGNLVESYLHLTQKGE